MIMDKEHIYAHYVALFTTHLSKQDAQHAAAMAAAMLTAGISFERQVLGAFGCAERLRDLADQIEHEGPKRGPLQ